MSQDIENKLEFKDKLFLFYRKNKFKIISLIILIFVVFLTLILINENQKKKNVLQAENYICLLYTSPSPRDRQKSRMPSCA